MAPAASHRPCHTPPMPGVLPRFEHRAAPIDLAAVTVDVIGFGVVMPVTAALLAAQSLSWGSARGCDGAAFVVAGCLVSAASLSVALFTVPPPTREPL